MATGDIALQSGETAAVQGSPEAADTKPAKHIVNDFSIQVATVNGSGSQSANTRAACERSFRWVCR